MEIEFTVQIDPERRKHEWHAALSFATACLLALVLIGLFYPPLWFCLTGMFIPLTLEIFARYRSMRSQQSMPDKIHIQGDHLIYLSNGKKSFSIPLATIGRIETKDGLKIFTKGLKQITVIDPHFFLSKFLAQSKRQKCDLFFPWFDPLVKSLLEDIVHADKSHHSSLF